MGEDGLTVDGRSDIANVFDGVEEERPSTDFVVCVAFFVVSPAVVDIWRVVGAIVP